MIFYSPCSQMVIFKLHQSIQIFLDGYFKIPRPFCQLLTMMAVFPDLNKALPIISCLINKKTKDAYLKFLDRADAIIREEF